MDSGEGGLASCAGGPAAAFSFTPIGPAPASRFLPPTVRPVVSAPGTCLRPARIVSAGGSGSDLKSQPGS